jgi:hypothetical protein
MLLMCDQCGFVDMKMLKLPSTLFSITGNLLTFENSSKDSYINMCVNCLGINEEKGE